MRKIAIANVVILAAVAAFAWEGPVDGGRLACDFVADGVVRVQYALGDKLQDNDTGVVVGKRSQGPGVRSQGSWIQLTGGDLAVEIDKASGRIIFKDAVTGQVLLRNLRKIPMSGSASTQTKSFTTRSPPEPSIPRTATSS